MSSHVNEETALDRLHRLQLRQREITLENNLEQLNKDFDVLIEGASKNNPKDLFGRTSQNKVVNIRNLDSSYIGKIVKVRTKEAHQNSFVCEVI